MHVRVARFSRRPQNNKCNNCDASSNILLKGDYSRLWTSTKLLVSKHLVRLITVVHLIVNYAHLMYSAALALQLHLITSSQVAFNGPISLRAKKYCQWSTSTWRCNSCHSIRTRHKSLDSDLASTCKAIMLRLNPRKECRGMLTLGSTGHWVLATNTE